MSILPGEVEDDMAAKRTKAQQDAAARRQAREAMQDPMSMLMASRGMPLGINLSGARKGVSVLHGLI